MKKLVLMFAAAVAISFASCGGNKTADTEKEAVTKECQKEACGDKAECEKNDKGCCKEEGKGHCDKMKEGGCCKEEGKGHCDKMKEGGHCDKKKGTYKVDTDKKVEGAAVKMAEQKK